ncbi:hypothetical protein SNOG_16542 [Parastagonospora nodorum SN15]|uniref:Uncharacterized protein n=1 Tax=Phaeosphaeria nodorum (strain SN15 / ATCC MYA-4574 / FGSC 10173) TaxID=321614 RepID=Q0TVC2_PHANO|nr:hypothetical protein SNOG_16542 [Parastagonospora nodorum SN15]EAT76082.1 hypothetical protein SNOG_16542 [Parastagonospora nodorum SN15]
MARPGSTRQIHIITQTHQDNGRAAATTPEAGK